MVGKGTNLSHSGHRRRCLRESYHLTIEEVSVPTVARNRLEYHKSLHTITAINQKNHCKFLSIPRATDSGTYLTVKKHMLNINATTLTTSNIFHPVGQFSGSVQPTANISWCHYLQWEEEGFLIRSRQTSYLNFLRFSKKVRYFLGIGMGRKWNFYGEL